MPSFFSSMKEIASASATIFNRKVNEPILKIGDGVKEGTTEAIEVDY
jgi:hypothetical protein